MALEIFRLAIVVVLVPSTLWMILRGEQQMTRRGAWSMAITSLLLSLNLALETFAPAHPVSGEIWRLRAFALLGMGICAAGLLGWLYVTRGHGASGSKEEPRVDSHHD